MINFKHFVVENSSFTPNANIASTLLNTPRKLENLLQRDCIILEKYDGLKISVVKIHNTGKVINDFVVSYHRQNKSAIIYGDEYDNTEDLLNRATKLENRNNLQYQLIWRVLKENENHLKTFPLHMLIKLEFLAKKDTLRVQYQYPFNSIIVGYAQKATLRQGEYMPNRSGNFILSETALNTNYEQLKEIAETYFSYQEQQRTQDLQQRNAVFFPPNLIFSGKLINFLTEEFEQQSSEKWLAQLNNYVNHFESELGGRGEGIILFANNKAYKIKRSSIEKKEIQEQDKTPFKTLFNGWLKNDESLKKEIYTQHNLKTAFDIAKEKINTLNIDEKNKDFFLGYVKGLIANQLPQNRYVLFVGRFSPMTQGHLEILKGLVNSNYSLPKEKVPKNVMMIVINRKTKNKENPFSAETKLELIKEVIAYHGLEIFVHVLPFFDGAKLGTILKTKVHGLVTHVLAGPERIKGYAQQLGNSVKYLVPQRNSTNKETMSISFNASFSNISATQLRDTLKKDQFNEFLKYFPTLSKERSTYWFNRLKEELNTF